MLNSSFTNQIFSRSKVVAHVLVLMCKKNLDKKPPSLYLSPISHCLSPTHYLTLILKHTHTHANTHTYTHSLSLSFSLSPLSFSPSRFQSLCLKVLSLFSDHQQRCCQQIVGRKLKCNNVVASFKIKLNKFNNFWGTDLKSWSLKFFSLIVLVYLFYPPFS